MFCEGGNPVTLLPWAGFVAFAAALLLAAIAMRLLSQRPVQPADADWFRRFRPERYLPMLRLLDSSEFRFLERQPGATRSMIRQLRRRRLVVLHGYLRSMRDDFNRLQALGQALIGAGVADRALADALFQSRVEFFRAWWGFQIRIALYKWGVTPAAAGKLVGVLGSLDRALRVPQPVAS
jgi:hypothetical protein